MFIKLDTVKFYLNVQTYSNITYNRITATGPLHDDVHALVHEVTAWGIPDSVATDVIREGQKLNPENAS
jgi:hypothetical protein